MAILRVNNVGDPTGTVNPITLTSAAATTATWVTPPLNMPTVASPNVLKVIAEPNTSNEEIMYLTAYTGSATSATVTRAQEGTTARTHTSTAWAHGPTAADFPPLVNVGDLLVGGANGVPTALPVGLATQVLTPVSGTPTWQAPVNDSGWYAFPLSTGAAAYGSSFRTPSVRVITIGAVAVAYLDGLIAFNGSGIASSATIGTLPANARPPYEVLGLVMSDTGPVRVDVNPSGIINSPGGPAFAAGHWLSCSNITFLTS